jgi:DNA-binding MarR family transcriptional regulator
MKSDEAALILRATLSLGRRLRAERPQKSASLSAIAILSALRRLGPVSAVRLAAEERLQPQSLTRILSTLEAGGLIARTASEADRRAVSIAITRRGGEVLAADMRARRDWLQQAVSATLSASERDTLLKAAEVMLKLAGYEAG